MSSTPENALSILCVVLGLLIIGSRGPLMLAPAATTRFYRALLKSAAGVRALGALVGALGAGLMATAPGEVLAHRLLFWLGCLLAAAGVLILVAPSLYRHIASPVVEMLATSVDEALIRILGGLGVAFGVALILAGLYWV